LISITLLLYINNAINLAAREREIFYFWLHY